MVIIKGKIKGKARPRICKGHAFTPKDTVAYEQLVRLCYKEQDNRFIEGSIRANIVAYYKIPKSYTKKRVQAIREGRELPTKKPDADNIAKIILDSLNGVAFKDDAQVISLSIEKVYTEDEERIELELEGVI
ncbi:RusA family crossover junction endodeoxyribonuclease [Clostridium sp. LY3-2]|uniref:RusA family crossover junction endodeoxyribonuclease n=1 Tax=Clostridium sp. LY3-2 TaxID=2942482 RepID=UPI002153A27D|nr:RusA family crossover junction endodeoxyribonuclease [Clostridium sp. LY3-2]MCR6515319.1 RusA family crossover junction endodeoxyribonuclease [Clostridium sp. LY3-2]